jgi:phospholipid/cholesterol/gamma-HCH transport system permease protein
MESIATIGDFARFSGRTLAWVCTVALKWRNVRLLLAQMFDVGTRSVPVVLIVGFFVGAVLAAQSVLQFKAVGLEAKLGTIVNLSVVRELGPVLAGVVLAGRVGGALAAELGTMRVTEQIDALRAMGADPVRVLAMPRFLACLLLMPFLVLYVDLTGILGGYLVGVHIYGVNSAEFWQTAAATVEFFDVFSGLLKGFVFGGMMSLIACYRGFRCRPGAAGVGRACTESFVESTMVILAVDFFMGIMLNTYYLVRWGAPPVG